MWLKPTKEVIYQGITNSPELLLLKFYRLPTVNHFMAATLDFTFFHYGFLRAAPFIYS